jgi:tryptophan synthase alpha chain
MSRIQKTFEELAKSGKKALIPFITAGDPSPQHTVPAMHALVRGGADIIELGVPFSDPMADGPVIQRASERALKHGVGLSVVLQCVRDFRQSNSHTPVVLMGYANPVERMGVARFVAEAAKAGVDGVLIVDYPPEECVEYAALMKQHGLDVIFLLAPTSTDERIGQVAEIANGYVYYVSLKGVTGNNAIDLSDVRHMLGKIRQKVRVPLAVGFGIRDGAMARQIAGLADAVVIGSRIIQEMENHQESHKDLTDYDAMSGAVEQFLTGIRQAMDK